MSARGFSRYLFFLKDARTLAPPSCYLTGFKVAFLFNLNQHLGRLLSWQLVFLSLVLLVVIGSLDYFTGSEISFAVFYLIPIAFAAWYLGWMAGFSLSVLSAAFWWFVDFSLVTHYSEAWIPYWNAFTRFLIFIAVSRLLSSLKTNLNKQRDLLRIDALTRVSSLRAFEEEAEKVFHLSQRHGYSVSLGFIDLDGFKQLNDSLGHGMGDRVLKEVGVQLNKHCRVGDTVARVGGDEFVVLLPFADLEKAEKVFTKLREHLLQAMAEKSWNISFSIGVAVFSKGDKPYKEALQTADALMYQVKKSGKNAVRYEVF